MLGTDNGSPFPLKSKRLENFEENIRGEVILI